ncbi:hypothetical protein F5Y14DRAFT_431987 [Nemania sp. NC0429]|nr:hypothetical protein F5Y14DRAFT_431987 [Nemania sp. NC0429]
MECPSCGFGSQSSRSDTEAALSSTHDTSATSYHILLPDWLKELDQAVKTAFPKRFVGYTKVAVLMICWHETYYDAMRIENRRLASVFRDVYKYSVERWWIPSTDPDRAIYKRIDTFLDEYGSPGNLLIVYYAGHARHNPAGGYFPIWQPRSEPERGKQIDTATFHPLLVRAEDNSPDVVLLYDCCFSLASHRSNSNNSKAEVEGLFAGGFESQVPIPGQDSFTKHLTDALATAPESGRTLTIAELHRQIIVRLQSFHEQAVFDANHEIRRCRVTGKVLHTKSVRVTPSHLFLAGNEKPRLIALRPLNTDEPQDDEALVEDSKSIGWPKVLLAVRLLDQSDIQQELQDWILSAPPGVVEFRGLLPSFSSLLLIEVPIVVWDLLPPCPAVSFVSFTVDPSEATFVSAPDKTTLDTPSDTIPTPTPTPQMECSDRTSTILEHDPKKTAPGSQIPVAKLPLRPPSPALSTSIIGQPHRAERKLLFANTPGQLSLVSLLDRADAYIRQILQDWRSLPTHDGLSREVWLLREFRMRLEEQTATSDSISPGIPPEHQEFISRYLSTHEFLSHDNPLINMTSRLNPFFTYRFRTDADVPFGSVTNPTTVQSSIWDSQTRGSISEHENYTRNVPVGEANRAHRFHHLHRAQLDDTYRSKDIDEHEERYDERPEDFYADIRPQSGAVHDSNTANETYTGGNTTIGENPGPAVVEPIDERFRVEPSYKFQPGEVLKILWSEPVGQSVGDALVSDVRSIENSAGTFYVGYRRFIIVSTDESENSTCVPILTYNRRGCSKRGVEPTKHGIVHEIGTKPRPLKAEPDLGFEPIAIEIYASGEKLAKESRVDYSKLITIDHNVRVFFIGRVGHSDFDKVQYAVDACWNKKISKQARR